MAWPSCFMPVAVVSAGIFWLKCGGEVWIMILFTNILKIIHRNVIRVWILFAIFALRNIN